MLNMECCDYVVYFSEEYWSENDLVLLLFDTVNK